MLFDTHAHFYGETLFAHLAARGAVPRVEIRHGERWMVTPTSAFPLAGGFVSLDARLAWMAAQGIDRQMITFPGALGPDVLPIHESLPLVRDVNDELAATCRAHPAGFVALAGLPLADTAQAARELHRAVRTLGLAGAIIPSNYFHSLAGIAALAPVLEAAETVGAHLMLHPGQRHDEHGQDPAVAAGCGGTAEEHDQHAGEDHAEAHGGLGQSGDEDHRRAIVDKQAVHGYEDQVGQGVEPVVRGGDEVDGVQRAAPRRADTGFRVQCPTPARAPGCVDPPSGLL